MGKILRSCRATRQILATLKMCHGKAVIMVTILHREDTDMIILATSITENPGSEKKITGVTTLEVDL